MWVRRLLIIALILVAAASLSYLNPAAEQSMAPLQKATAVLRSLFSSSSDLEGSDKPDPTQGSTTRVYKWQDADGNWQFSNQPPAEGVASSSRVYRSDTNVTQAVTPRASASEPTSSPEKTPAMASPLMPITDPGRVRQLVDDARNVQGLIDQRQQDLEQHSLNQ